MLAVRKAALLSSLSLLLLRLLLHALLTLTFQLARRTLLSRLLTLLGSLDSHLTVVAQLQLTYLLYLICLLTHSAPVQAYHLLTRLLMLAVRKAALLSSL